MFIKEHFKGYILSWLLIINFFVWYGVLREERNVLKVAFLDVGQGDAIFIEAPNGKQILIDGGPNGAVLRELSKIMPFYDRSIDMVILTHPDQDHIGGLPTVLESYKVDFVMESGVGANNGTYEEFEKLVEQKNIKKILARQGTIVELCDFMEARIPQNSAEAELLQGCGEYLEILFPNMDASGFETNTASVVTKLVYGKNSFLFTGDAPQSVEKYLSNVFEKQLDVDVLKLGHHGSSSSNSEVFLGFTSPDYTIASVGLNNRYGHPHKEVVDLLRKLDIPFLRTDDLGTILFTTDGESLKIKH